MAKHFGIYALFIFPDAFRLSRSCLTALGFHKVMEKSCKMQEATQVSSLGFNLSRGDFSLAIWEGTCS